MKSPCFERVWKPPFCHASKLSSSITAAFSLQQEHPECLLTVPDWTSDRWKQFSLIFTNASFGRQTIRCAIAKQWDTGKLSFYIRPSTSGSGSTSGHFRGPIYTVSVAWSVTIYLVFTNNLLPLALSHDMNLRPSLTSTAAECWPVQKCQGDDT